MTAGAVLPVDDGNFGHGGPLDEASYEAGTISVGGKLFASGRTGLMHTSDRRWRYLSGILDSTTSQESCFGRHADSGRAAEGSPREADLQFLRSPSEEDGMVDARFWLFVVAIVAGTLMVSALVPP